MSKILITTSSFDTEIEPISQLKRLGYEVVLNPYKRRLTEDEVTSLMGDDVIGMIAGVEPLTRRVMDSAPNMVVISRCGIGMDSVDVETAAQKSIEVLNTPDAPTKAVAELTIGLILDVLRGISNQDRAIRQSKWERPMGALLGKKTLGLIGYGRIGQMVARYAEVFGARVIAHDPFSGQKTSFDELLSDADIVSLHIPYTTENHHIINAEALSVMKKSAILINASRGGLVDESALYDALKAGDIAGAALDVYEDEPYTGNLTELDNVVLTAHVGSYAKEARVEQEILAAQNLLNALQKKQNQKVRSHG